MKRKKISVVRFENNPLLSPDPDSDWMSKNVFNPGVVWDDGWYKMLFRASWTDDQSMSNLGLALSTEGTRWYRMDDKPVLKAGFNDYCRWGIEDPRIVRWIDGHKYVFATAYSARGWRIGIWKTRNFLEFEWVGMPFDWNDKNASVLPEPIDGWAYLFHRKTHDIWISRTRDLTLKSGWQDSQILVKKDEFYRSPETGNPPVKIGLAGPPIKTKKGWLVVVHIVHDRGMGRAERGVYSLSFMVLKDDPKKIEYIHSSGPILRPEEEYETTGAVPMVCFSSAIVDPGGDTLYLYWGAADTVVCGGKLLKEDLPMCY